MSGPRVMVAWRWWYHRCEGMQSGQMTVELAVLVPVVIVVALIVANLMEFVDACAAFDRLSLDEVIAEGGLSHRRAGRGSIRRCGRGCSSRGAWP